jgi:DNA-binding transcriptional MerR regulator
MLSRDPLTNTGRWLGPGELARTARTSIKALRVYEKAGLLAPDRREGGWRLYGPKHVARLYQIMALKALGLSLKQIGDTLDGDDLTTSRIMDLQARQLATMIRNTRAQLQRVQLARQQLADGNIISSDMLLDLARDLASPTRFDPADVQAAIVAAVHDPAEQEAVKSVVDGPAVGQVTERDITALLDEAAICAAAADPDSASARSLADRWLALADLLKLQDFDTEEDSALRRVVARMIDDPLLVEPLTFLRAAVERRTSHHKKG